MIKGKRNTQIEEQIEEIISEINELQSELSRLEEESSEVVWGDVVALEHDLNIKRIALFDCNGKLTLFGKMGLQIEPVLPFSLERIIAGTNYTYLGNINEGYPFEF